MSTPEPLTSGVLVAIVLAAGAGRRFDPSGANNKLLAALGDTSVVAATLRRIHEAALPAVVVIRPGQTALKEALVHEACEIVTSPQAHLGMGHSLAAGVAAVRQRTGLRGVMICLADMPFIRPATYSAVALAALADLSTPVAAAHDGVRGNPVVFPAHLFDALSSLDGDSGAARILRANPPRLVECDDAAVLRDIDKPGDLDAAPGDGALPPAANFWEKR